MEVDPFFLRLSVTYIVIPQIMPQAYEYNTEYSE